MPAFKGVVGKSIILEESKTVEKPALPKKKKVQEEVKQPLPKEKKITTAQYMEQDVDMEQCDKEEDKQGVMTLTDEEQATLLLR